MHLVIIMSFSLWIALTMINNFHYNDRCPSWPITIILCRYKQSLNAHGEVQSQFIIQLVNTEFLLIVSSYGWFRISIRKGWAWEKQNLSNYLRDKIPLTGGLSVEVWYASQYLPQHQCVKQVKYDLCLAGISIFPISNAVCKLTVGRP